MLLAGLVGAPAAEAAVSVSRAELSGQRLRVEGRGAVANAPMFVDGTGMGNADGSGNFRLERDGFSSPTCRVTVSDGNTSAQATLSGCTASQPPPSSSAPAAPTVLSPANGASVTQPVRLDWSDVTDLNGPVIGYDWQVAATSGFTSVIAWGTPWYPAEGQPPPSEDRLSGLPNGTYFWRVRTIRKGMLSESPVKSDWTPARTLTVTGSAAGTPAAPVVTSPASGARFHPFEFFEIRWDTVPGAAKYVFEYDDEPTFSDPLVGSHENTQPFSSVGWGEPVGTIYYRARAINAEGVRSLPSPTRTYVIAYDAPVPPPPSLVSPAEGAALEGLPVRFDWADQPNPQPGMYELWVDDDPSFTGGCGEIEECWFNITQSEITIGGLDGGRHYWKVRSFHGEAGPGIGATGGFSAVRSFTLPVTPPQVTGFRVHPTTIHSGDHFEYGVEVVPFPPRGEPDVPVEITSDNPAIPSPGTVFIPSGQADVFGRIFTSQAPIVEQDTLVTLTASHNGSSKSVQILVKPPAIGAVDIGAPLEVPATFAGGASATVTILFFGIPPPGAVIGLNSTNPAAHVPPTFITDDNPGTVNAVTVTTDRVTSTQSGFVEATWKGVTVRKQIVVHPPPTLVSPADNASAPSGSTVTFDWEDLAGLTYNLQIDDSPSFAAPLLLDQAVGTSTFFTNRLPVGTLHWRVRTVDPYGQFGDWSQVRVLNSTGVAQPLTAPTLSFPTDGARVNRGQSITFDWSDVTGAASYQLQVDQESGFAAPFVLDRSGLTASHFPTSTLPSGKYRWRARAIGSTGTQGPWSSSRRLEVR